MTQVQPDLRNKPVATPPDLVLIRRIGLLVFFAGLGVLGFQVVQGFIAPLVWAAILAYIAWPLYQWLHGKLGLDAVVGALLTTLLIAVLIVAPLLFGGAMLAEELSIAYQALRDQLVAGPLKLPQALADIPWLGERLQEQLNRFAADPQPVRDWLAQHGAQWLGEVRGVLGAIGRNAIKLGIALTALFFFLRDGDRLAFQLHGVLEKLLGGRVREYWRSVAETTRGVVYGWVLAALAQGVTAGVGYWGAGVASPVLLGAATILFAMIPFGAPLMWVSIGGWMLAIGQPWAGISVWIWGAVVVSNVDNLIRPLAISSSTQIPFLLVLVGVFGGLQAFGLVGLFTGPIILAVVLAVWREWLEEQTEELQVEIGESPEGPES
ncbi:MAG: AI-2E family transporter [Gammaproteobacteria bacterium]|nr:AI-2E family transporter [Gammaproteobacteria bacterium]MBU1655519.1 AI-2E family transporter [Gammaproteobacteria bacterium]MBU1961267.1 AI-2E family transporter [Gammaproteobacteria bacterium]